MSLNHLLSLVYNRLTQLLSTAPRGALSVTGILGLALLVYGYLQLRGNENQAEEQRRRRQEHAAAALPDPHPRPAAAGAAARAPAAAAAPVPSAPNAVSAASATPAGRAVAAQLTGVKRVTLSLPGVVFAESTPRELQESATSRGAPVLEVLGEMCRVSDLYLIAHVEDDVGEAVVTGSLEAAGLVGPGPGQVKPHHVLCCSTLEGKVPIVRQLEPDLHVDAHSASVDELRRFLPTLLLVREGSVAGQSYGASNVGLAPSLPAFFGL
ncbi:Peroxisome biogenesis protein 22 [Tetrabaena socialis]|uniref:Peroxisome biogenesis protein 22 n=1 Tax=Tetrabaena socialis TaxID=47790 RepID=A0A2J7ZWB9_9CHLO|nr:Peroxisome biogenesis protein 22 [Tetrabaena socialis]|eukprot:PNH04545.1 Peroxisome biogenesis protein 22 [Tetrabaena socialis]